MSAGDPRTRSRSTLLRAGSAAALVAAMALASADLAAARTVGPDISSHNHDNRATVNFSVMHRVGGAAFTFIKATEGSDYVNPRFASDFHRAGQAMVRGAYHFARPSGVTFTQIAADATAEADFFIWTTGTMEGKGILPPVLDLENAGTLNPTQLSRWAHTWLRRVKALTGRNPIVYTNGGFWKHRLRNSRTFRSYPLWLASYGVARPVVPGGWKRYTFWQHTDRGRLAGAGLRLDLSVFNGSRAELQALTVKTSVASKAAQEAVAAWGATGPTRSHERTTRSVASQASRAHATRMESTRFTWVTTRYLTRLKVPNEESRRRTWSDVLDRGGIREIGR